MSVVCPVGTANAQEAFAPFEARCAVTAVEL